VQNTRNLPRPRTGKPGGNGNIAVTGNLSGRNSADSCNNVGRYVSQPTVAPKISLYVEVDLSIRRYTDRFSIIIILCILS
jgi:hypothetical protein